MLWKINQTTQYYVITPTISSPWPSLQSLWIKIHICLHLFILNETQCFSNDAALVVLHPVRCLPRTIKRNQMIMWKQSWNNYMWPGLTQQKISKVQNQPVSSQKLPKFTRTTIFGRLSVKIDQGMQIGLWKKKKHLIYKFIIML